MTIFKFCGTQAWQYSDLVEWLFTAFDGTSITGYHHWILDLPGQNRSGPTFLWIPRSGFLEHKKWPWPVLQVETEKRDIAWHRSVCFLYVDRSYSHQSHPASDYSTTWFLHIGSMLLPRFLSIFRSMLTVREFIREIRFWSAASPLYIYIYNIYIYIYIYIYIILYIYIYI